LILSFCEVGVSSHSTTISVAPTADMAVFEEDIIPYFGFDFGGLDGNGGVAAIMIYTRSHQNIYHLERYLFIFELDLKSCLL
jgi:hypothetical protein